MPWKAAQPHPDQHCVLLLVAQRHNYWSRHLCPSEHNACFAIKREKQGGTAARQRQATPFKAAWQQIAEMCGCTDTTLHSAAFVFMRMSLSVSSPRRGCPCSWHAAYNAKTPRKRRRHVESKATGIGVSPLLCTPDTRVCCRSR